MAVVATPPERRPASGPDGASTEPRPASRRERPRGLARIEARNSYLFMLPAVLGFLLFTLGPMIFSLVMSFMDYGVITAPQWVGLDNWRRALFEDPLVWQSLRVTLYYAVGSVVLTSVLAFLVALLMNQPIVGQRVFRTIYYMPSVISGVPVAILWTWIFNPTIGVINTALRWVGIEGPRWLTSPEWVIPALILMSSWSIGGAMVIYLAGLQGVPNELYEAAQLDGAGAVRRTLSITLPMVSPVIFFNLVMSIIGSLQVFTQAYVMTEGGPINSSLFAVLYIYRNAFFYFQMGYGSTLAWILFLVIGLLTLLVFRSQRIWVHEEAQS
ncbi:carbohydrate ABC transporter permease [Pseudactinotalea suaedae]|uniref:carbohydrate ABC transporter permease n=1 Tax=Pseudactinotalea suaedae TaxID=1524924 RepID=UPI001F4F339D|nr:sugar ABC transporter permease [Pseudactinotalea suaedae]